MYSVLKSFLKDIFVFSQSVQVKKFKDCKFQYPKVPSLYRNCLELLNYHTELDFPRTFIS